MKEGENHVLNILGVRHSVFPIDSICKNRKKQFSLRLTLSKWLNIFTNVASALFLLTHNSGCIYPDADLGFIALVINLRKLHGFDILYNNYSP